MKISSVVVGFSTLVVASEAFTTGGFQSRAFGIATDLSAKKKAKKASDAPAAVAESESEPEAAPAPAPAPPAPKKVELQALTNLSPTPDEEGSVSWAEKTEMAKNVFECHDFFLDLRTEDQLPASVLKMRESKTEKEWAAIKKKYNGMSEADEAFAVLCDLGLMEDYGSLGEYSDDFDDYAS